MKAQLSLIAWIVIGIITVLAVIFLFTSKTFVLGQNIEDTKEDIDTAANDCFENPESCDISSKFSPILINSYETQSKCESTCNHW